MPCRSDYLCASGQELESKRVCKSLLYAKRRLDEAVPPWVDVAANDYYGNVARLDEATKLLCACIRGMDPEQLEAIVYDAHNVEARELANWWERHQEWDRRRVAEEEESRKKIMLKERALRKLDTDEMKALGLL